MDKKTNRIYIIAWIVIMAAGTALMFIGITHESLWYDESYTAALTNHSLWDIIIITGSDSHPPLYYLVLRIYSMLFGSSVLALRTFSVIGTVALAALGIGPVRRAFGNRFGLIYSFLIFALPITFSMSQEARMYTWSAFFVTSSALWGYLAYLDGKRKDWIIFGVTSLFAAYTHYYALLAAIIIFGLLLLMMLIKKKKMASYFITAGIMVAGYLPWLFMLAGQVKRVTNSFWIPPVTGQVIKNTLIYPFSNKFSFHLSLNLVQIGFLIAALFIVFGILYRIIKKDKNGSMAIFAVGVYALTILAGVIASYIIRPVFVERYMMPVLGLFVIGIAYGIGSMGKKVLPVIGCLLILGISIPQINFTINYQFNGPMAEATEYIESVIQPGDVFLHTDEHTLGTFCYYFPENEQFYFQKEGTGGFSNYDAFLPTGTMIDSIDDIECDGTVWLIQRYGSADTSSMRKWLSSGDIKYAGISKPFGIDTSWYSFMVYPMELGK